MGAGVGGMIDILFFGSGVYLIYMAVMAKKNGNIVSNVMLAKSVSESSIKDKLGFIDYMYKRILLAGVMIVIASIIHLVNDYYLYSSTLTWIGIIVILAAIGSMMLALLFLFRVDIAVPFVATIAFAFVIAALILNEARKNRIDMVITEKKCSRAVFLSNRVKIKYVNNVRTLDYMSHKYQVRNATELEFVFGQYRKAKREWARQRESTIRLNENNQILMQELQRLGIRDREIWFAQAKALVDPKEMVEVRHDLNVRRQKLREQLDYNTGVMEECLEEMERIRDKKLEYAEEVERILGK